MNVDSLTHPRSEVLGGNLCIQTSRTPTYIAGARTFIHVYILSTAKFPERLSNKQQTLFFNPQKQTSSPEGESIQMQSKCKQAQ